MKKPKNTLSSRTTKLIDELVEAAKSHGWQEDQGTGTAPERARRAYLDARKALERRLRAQEQQAKRDRAEMTKIIDAVETDVRDHS